ncbi:metallophosphoesterase [Enterococcus sp. BWB1-3]|uniref:metallophosphoesterase n=1 Tax=unclassified Enterococcus TaxID=2608891 RepID=UPI0019220A75|nr:MULTISPECIES: metallophosphoesterase [unclassified Enterococcus]MBL1227843.1 metallophosphoesterase [Enterococcus sp. BWB1-3]MCB5953157.1 metallophosphoesterase [Enterococcus sp. BWT-B8]MCB5956185.1 metallophosphoesterase [Enterococcus sp. CWB-B31]
MKRLLLTFLSIVVLGIALAGYAFFIEPKRITINHHSLGTNTGQTPVKVLQLSDIHLKKDYSTEQLKKIVTAANNEEPDIIVFTGDLFDNFAKYGPINETIALMNELKAPLGKFAIWGNHDYGGGAHSVYPNIWSSSGFHLLKNTGTTIQTADNKMIYLTGIDDAMFGTPSIEEAIQNRRNADYTILLSHEPDVVDTAVNYDISLILSGHSHGGQVNIPFIPVTNVLAEKYTKGFYALNAQTTLYVNTGLGTTLISARFRVPPEIAVFQLYI